LNTKTNKMKELAAQINMYQAKVFFNLCRPIKINLILKEHRNKFSRSEGNTINRKRENK